MMLKVFKKLKSKAASMLVTKHDREKVAYFIEKARISSSYRSSLQSDHEPNEIDEQMMCYEKHMVNRKAKLLMYEFASNELVFDKLSKEEQEKKFLEALDYSCKFYPSATDRVSMVKLFLKCYGTPSMVNRFKLQASIKGDFELESAINDL